MSCFSEGYPHIRLFEQKTDDTGLYKNQIAAVGAALAHFSTKDEPALITMPTGTGKTAVMILLSYLLKANKVLVITPSQLVREQIANQFRSPNLLYNKGIFTSDVKAPSVYELKTLEHDSSVWIEILKAHDVVVGIPGTLNQIRDVGNILGKDSFDLIFVDEAHHSRAESWTSVLQAFESARQILLTATPFRRDKKDIKARLIYNYPLKQAFEEKLFSEIKFVAVNTQNLATDEQKNVAIAKKSEEVYKARSHKNHKIIVRTDRKSSADELHQIYLKNTQLKLDVIHSKLGERTIRHRIKKLTDGELDGIICVDMMGEGFDFPSLKIAAVHIPHKSLAITLQFIGRISRTNTEAGNIATVVGGEHEFQIESYQLYRRDNQDWSVVLPDLHKAKIQKTEDEQEFFDSFEDLTEPQPKLDGQQDPISIEDDNLRPFFHCKVYQILNVGKDPHSSVIDISTAIDFSGTDALESPIITHHHVSLTHEVSIYVVSELSKPKWFTGDEQMNDVSNHLFVIYFDRDNSILFICATIKDNELYESIASQYLNDDVVHDVIPLPILKRLMAGWVEPKLYNVGMKSRKTKGNSESYKNILGSLAQLGVLPSDKFNYTRGHSFGGGFDPILQKHMLIGISTSSKIWALEDNKIKYLVEWCKHIARKIGDPEMDKLASPLSDLDSGKVVDQFPKERVFFVDWDSSQYHRLTTIVFIDKDDEVAESALICSCELKVIDQNDDRIVISISKSQTNCSVEYSLKPKAKFSYLDNTEHKIAIRKGQSFGNLDAFLSILNSNPIHLYYESFAKLVGRVLFPFNGNTNTINDEQIQVHNWPTDVNIRKEYFSETEKQVAESTASKQLSIHDYIIELAKAEYDVVFYDHGSLEIADIIGFKKGKIQFYHCKKQAGDSPRCDVEDIYEVCGQAVKSVNWAHRKLLLNQLCERGGQNGIAGKMKKGAIDDVRKILDAFDNPLVPITITIVQPGLKTSSLTKQQEAAFERIKVLLSGVDTFLREVSQCRLSIMCS